MSEELISPNPYNYSFDDSLSAYCFSTAKGIVYRFAFTEDYTFNSIASNDEFENQYQLIVERVSGDSLNHDPRIADTISNIIIRFFEDKRNSLLCIYSDENGREKHRFIVFERWYKKNPAKSYIEKIDRILEIEFKGESRFYYTSFLFHKENPNKERLLEVYDKLEDSLNK